MARFPERIEVESEGRRIVYVLRPGSETPEYDDADGGGTATASGRIWVRFADGEDANAHAADLANAGYEIDHIPGYAPNAAYVRAPDLAASLAHLDKLRAVAGVTHVEPELLRARSFRR